MSERTLICGQPLLTPMSLTPMTWLLSACRTCCQRRKRLQQYAGFLDASCAGGSRSGRFVSCHCSSQTLDGANDVASRRVIDPLPQTRRRVSRQQKKPPVACEENARTVPRRMSEAADRAPPADCAGSSPISHGFDSSCVMEVLAQSRRNTK